MVWSGLMWLRIGTSGGFLWTQYWTFGFHKMLGSSWVAAQLAAPQEGLSSVSEWVSKWVSIFWGFTYSNNYIKKRKPFVTKFRFHTVVEICIFSKLKYTSPLCCCSSSHHYTSYVW
jgi:hypothetical protein